MNIFTKRHKNQSFQHTCLGCGHSWATTEPLAEDCPNCHESGRPVSARSRKSEAVPPPPAPHIEPSSIAG